MTEWPVVFAANILRGTMHAMPIAAEPSLPGGANGFRERNLFAPDSETPYRLSRSKVELFVQCARCFYLDRRKGVGRPDGPTMSLNTAVDALLKREFDQYRRRAEAHPIMQLLPMRAIPFLHPSLNEWRDNARGIRVLHGPTNFLVHGAVDDLWIGEDGALILVDYKATSSERIPSLGGQWGGGYRRQAELYQWLLRRSGFPVARTAYFLFANADRTLDRFDNTLRFQLHLLPYEGSDDWVDDALKEARICLCRDTPPVEHPDCVWCAYRKASRHNEEW